MYLIRIAWVKFLGGLYLVYLTYQHFFQSGDAQQRSQPRPAKPWMGLSALWGTIVKVELVNVAFSVDSILVAVAMSSKTWVVLAGGLIGIVAMRVVISQLLVYRAEIPDARRWRVHHHRARRYQAASRIRRCDGVDPLRTTEVGLAGDHRRDLPDRLVGTRAAKGLFPTTVMKTPPPSCSMETIRKAMTESADCRILIAELNKRRMNQQSAISIFRDYLSVRLSVLVSPSPMETLVAFGFSRSSTSGSFHSPCAR